MYTSDKAKVIMIKLTILTITGLALFGITNAYADHVDNHIWIETADGSFVKATENILELTKGERSYDDVYGKQCNAGSTYEFSGFPRTYPNVWTKPETEFVNGDNMIDTRDNKCGNKAIEDKHLESITTMEYIVRNSVIFKDYPEQSKLEYIQTIEVEEPNYTEYHECVCGYWYSNTIQDKYTYTILDMPRDRELPPNYTETIHVGTKAGFDRWGKINGIEFTYTDSRLNANIIIQPQIGDNTAYGNAEIGCLFENNQCTIQLFPDLNVLKQQTLVNSLSIEFTIAHEFGHLIGLPHHVDPGHVMNTVHAKDVRTYYEARGINVPNMIEPTYEQRLLENENGNTYTGDINTDNIMNHETVTEFIAYIDQILQSTPQEDRFSTWFEISNNIFQELRNTIFN